MSQHLLELTQSHIGLPVTKPPRANENEGTRKCHKPDIAMFLEVATVKTLLQTAVVSCCGLVESSRVCLEDFDV